MEKVCIIGLGYVGLPLACLCAKRNLEVIGVDLKQYVVDKTNKKICHFEDEIISKSLYETTDNLIATTDISLAKDATKFIICVPTPIDNNKEPNFKPLQSATRSLLPYLKKGDLVVVESTIFPGTCEEVVVPILKESKLKPAKDIFLAHCPERVNPGDVFWTTENIPRVVGALSQKGVEITAKFYQLLLGGEVYDVKDIKKKLRPKIIQEGENYRINSMPLKSITKMHSIRDAEAVKAMENTVRDVNIAFVNELARISDVLGLDVVDIIDGMSTKPFGKGPYYPGIGVGGHCIAVDPEWLKAASIKAGYTPKLIQLSRDTNNTMPKYAINQLEKNLKSKNISEVKIAVLGVTYKGNIDDPRESPFYDVKKILQTKNAKFVVFDPWFKGENTADTLKEALEFAEVVLIVTDHSYFKEEVTAELLAEKKIWLVIDGRNCLDKDEIELKNIMYEGIGR